MQIKALEIEGLTPCGEKYDISNQIENTIVELFVKNKFNLSEVKNCLDSVMIDLIYGSAVNCDLMTTNQIHQS